jgi:DUF1680 family protein
MLSRISRDRSLLPALEKAWEHLVTRRMYITGGIGSLPGMEGFGRDYELDPEFAYAETCAALGSLFWNWEMAQLTGEAKYSDLFEWQLYNAASTGMGLDGTTYLYNNPLTCHGGVTRRAWYAVPCCPSNLSRTWANIGQYIFSCSPGTVWLHQYIGSQLTVEMATPDGDANFQVCLEMASDLPWHGNVQLLIKEVSWLKPQEPASFDLLLRHPAWAGSMRITINGISEAAAPLTPETPDATASGYDPRPASSTKVSRAWLAGDRVVIELDMPVILRHPHPRLRGHARKVAVTRGPLVYCLEDVDNPGIDIFDVVLDESSLNPVFDETELGGSMHIEGLKMNGKMLRFIPYFLWGNRGPSRMNVWVKV